MPTITCPDCGVQLQSEHGERKLAFDAIDWSSRCKRLALGSPVWCLVHRDGTSPQRTSNECFNSAASHPLRIQYS
jgi:hypothetical protein